MTNQALFLATALLLSGCSGAADPTIDGSVDGGTSAGDAGSAGDGATADTDAGSPVDGGGIAIDSSVAVEYECGLDEKYDDFRHLCYWSVEWRTLTPWYELCVEREGGVDIRWNTEEEQRQAAAAIFPWDTTVYGIRMRMTGYFRPGEPDDSGRQFAIAENGMLDTAAVAKYLCMRPATVVTP